MGKYYIQGFGKYTMYNPDGTINEEGIECPSPTFELDKSAEFTSENFNIDNDNELLKPKNHNKELSLTLGVQPTKEFLRLFENNIFCKLKKIRKKYRSPKRRVQEYNKFFRRSNIVAIEYNYNKRKDRYK